MDKTKVKTLFILVLISILYSTQNSCTRLETNLSFGQATEQLKLKYKIPAISLVAFTADSILYSKTTGVRSILDSIEVQPTDAFHIGSNTKAFTATLGAIIVQSGKLNWDSKVLDVFPEFNKSSRPEYKTITFANLLAHRAGIASYSDKKSILSLPQYRGQQKEQRIQFTQWLLSQPSVYVGDYEYSNAGYCIAAAMLEKVTEKSWEDLVQEYLFHPLGIKGHFGWPINTQAGGVRGHYQPDDAKALIAHDGRDYQVSALIAPAGDLAMSTQDFSRYVQALLKGMTGKPSRIPLKKYDFMLQGPSNYGLGWKKETVNSNSHFFHFGSAGTFHSYAWFAPEENFGFVICLNAYTPESKTLLLELSNRLIQKQLESTLQ